MQYIKPDLNSPTINDIEAVSAYLEEGPIVIIAAGKEQDEKDPSKGNVVPVGQATDGTYVWPLSIQYYLQNYKIGFDKDFLAFIRSKNYVFTPISDEQLESVRKEASAHSSKDVDTSSIDLNDLIQDKRQGVDPWAK